MQTRGSRVASSTRSGDPRHAGHPSGLHGAAGRYLEAAYYLHQEGEEVRTGKLAEWLGVSPPSASEALRRLERDGLVVLDAAHRVELTEEGEAMASHVVRRHRVLEVWLTDVLGFDWVRADEEAHAIAPALSDQVLDRLQHSLGDPVTCPHGNLIPGSAAPARRLIRLTELEPGRSGQIARVSELAEHQAPSVLTFLYDAGIVPGRKLVVVTPDEGAGVMAIELDDGRLQHLSLAVADVLWVEAPLP